MPNLPIRISRLATAHPPYRLLQNEAARAIAAYAEEPRRVAALARGTRIDGRSIALLPREVVALGDAGARNEVYRAIAPGLAEQAASGVLDEIEADRVGCLVTTSCTGYMIPSWGVGLVEACGLPQDVVRLPITEAGCAGGVVAMSRAVDHLRAHPCSSALVTSVELCSLAFHPGGDDGNLTSTLIFGDGAGAALLERGEGPGLEILDTMSVLVPGTQEALGFDLTDHGLYPILTRELSALLGGPTREAVDRLLARNELCRSDIGPWLIHPGGARILNDLSRALDVDRGCMRWSWATMREHGNTSSAAIFEVMCRYFPERTPGELAVAAAFGPGLSIELLLLRAT